MAKETFYFSHDYEPTSDIKISAMVGEFGAVGYGIFWRIVELLHSEPTHKLPQRKYVYSAIAKQFAIDVEQVSTLVEFCLTECFLFEQDEDKIYFWSNRVLRNFDKRAEISESRSYAGKVSAEKRKQAKEAKLLEINKNNSTFVKHNSTNFNKEKEIKEKEIKCNEIIQAPPPRHEISPDYQNEFQMLTIDDCRKKYDVENVAKREQIAMNIKVNPQQIILLQNSFDKMLKTKTDKKGFKDYTDHFANWASKLSSEAIKEKIIASIQQVPTRKLTLEERYSK